MSDGKLSQLTRGDWVEITGGEKGTVQYFARFNGRKWVKASRNNADGAWVDVPNGSGGYVHTSAIVRQVSPPTMTEGNAGRRVTSAGEVATPTQQNFTQFAVAHGYPSDYDVLEHGDLSPSGHVSSAQRKQAQERHLVRLNANIKAHREYQEAILSGAVSDPSGEITKAKLERQASEASTKATESKRSIIEGQIRFIEGLGAMSHKPNGQLKASYQRTVDEYKAKLAVLDNPSRPGRNEPIGGKWAAYVKRNDGTFDLWLFDSKQAMEESSSKVRETTKSGEAWGRMQLPPNATLQALADFNGPVHLRTMQAGEAKVVKPDIQEDERTQAEWDQVINNASEYGGRKGVASIIRKAGLTRSSKATLMRQLRKATASRKPVAMLTAPDPRPARSEAIDQSITAKTVTDDYNEWAKLRNRIDLRGVDTKRPRSHPQNLPRPRATVKPSRDIYSHGGTLSHKPKGRRVSRRGLLR